MRDANTTKRYKYLKRKRLHTIPYVPSPILFSFSKSDTLRQIPSWRRNAKERRILRNWCSGKKLEQERNTEEERRGKEVKNKVRGRFWWKINTEHENTKGCFHTGTWPNIKKKIHSWCSSSNYYYNYFDYLS